MTSSLDALNSVLSQDRGGAALARGFASFLNSWALLGSYTGLDQLHQGPRRGAWSGCSEFFVLEAGHLART